ncbi:hypothetical protein [Brucella pituitosa]|uniref:hypothetical protein n=1 Tax=Brucella pituitosa TaxID=571256 RepID=UPI001FFDD54E|nr:hypothetical protein [Brucella pituitosa]
MTINTHRLASDWRQGRGYIHTYICEKIASSTVGNRCDILMILHELGLEITGQTIDSVSVINPQTGNRFTLRGKNYHENWTRTVS